MTAGPVPVFHDPRGLRWHRLRGSLVLVGAMASVVLIVAAASVVMSPLLPRFRLPSVAGLPRTVRLPLAPPTRAQVAAAAAAAVPAQRAADDLHRAEKHANLRPGKRPQLMKVQPPPSHPLAKTAVAIPRPSTTVAAPPIAAAFYVNWDDTSYASLRRNLSRLDWVIPEWARLDPAARSQPGLSPFKLSMDPRALDLMRRERPELRILPLLQNYHDDVWDGALVGALLDGEASRQRLVDALAELVAREGFGGVVIDFEEVPPEAQGALLSFLGALHARLAAHGLLLGEAVPFDDEDWNYSAHAAVTDHLFLMAYDEHWSTSAAGSVAGQPFYEKNLAARLRELDPARVMVCIGGYGYDWEKDEKEATVVSFAEAVRLAGGDGASLRFDGATRNPTVRYQDDDGTAHEVWFLDAATAYNQMAVARAAHVAGFALWRLGVEDPSLWKIFGVTPSSPAAPQKPEDALATVEFPYDVEFDGSGELLQAVATPAPGARTLTMEGEGEGRRVVDERYSALPTAYAIRRTGDREGYVSLTFDDGPDRTFTPQILDVLAQKNARATFFIIGENGADNPELVRRLVADGHDVGNHTYTHPNLGETSARVTDLELNATQRLIESLTGRGTTLFRPPYFGDAEPETPDEVEPILRAQALGYVAVGLKIDSDDWMRPGVDEIVRRTLGGAGVDPVTGALGSDGDRGHVVLLHDGGGDRSQTVAALPRIIDGLRAAHLNIVPISELAGLTRDQAMPPLRPADLVLGLSDSLLVYAIAVADWLLRLLFAVGLLLGFLRMALISILAIIQKIQQKPGREAIGKLDPAAKVARVSILVPAYNEEKVILRTVESLLQSTYPDYEILVIDDGSKDATYQLVGERYAGEPRVRAFTKENGGKAEALAFGLERATGEIIIGLDADTLFPPEVLVELCRPFADPRVAAVAGNAKVGNRINLVTRWQALEYVASQNLDRRAFALLNCITVVPGAVGAWRRTVLESLGGFRSDTLAEDQDLTLQVRRQGHRIAYAERAVAWTEAPDTLSALAKQRFRWSFGTLQCMWKHRRALLHDGTLGWVAMPNVWIFQILFPLLAPLVDLLLVGALLWAGLDRWEHPAAQTFTQLQPVLFYYALFLVVDWLSAALAFVLERGEEKSLLFWFLLQRVCYRQVMYYVLIKSVAAAFRGGVVGWGKLERKATARQGAG